MTPREQDDAAFAALTALPWVRTADRLPSPDTNGRWIVLLGPTPAESDTPDVWWTVKGTGHLAAKIALAEFSKAGWSWFRPDSLSKGPSIPFDVLAWLDVYHGVLDRLAEQLREPPR